jgi:thiol:disulfide interchange protein DsbD
MGTAIAASLTEPIWVIILIFLFLGLGLSFPFLLLLIFPSFSKHLPRPGAWMITLRQFMGLLMIATVFWLLWVLSQQCEESLATILAALWCLGVGFWGYGLLNAPVKSALSRILAKLILFASVLISAHLFWNISKNDHQTLSTKSTIDDNTDTLVFEPYSEERINQALASDSPIIINFTAKWCLTCQISKKLALDTPEVKAKIKEKGIILFEADWTHHNELITKKLEFFNQNSIPFFVYYPGKNQPPVFLSTLFTKEEILELLK